MSMTAAHRADRAATAPAIVAHLGCHTRRATTASAAGRIDVQEAGHDHHGHKLRIRVEMQAAKGGTTTRHAGPDSTTARSAKHAADTAADKPVSTARGVVVAEKGYLQSRARRIRRHHVVHLCTTLAASPRNHALNGLHNCTVVLPPLTTRIVGAGLSAKATCTHVTPLMHHATANITLPLPPLCHPLCSLLRCASPYCVLVPPNGWTPWYLCLTLSPLSDSLVTCTPCSSLLAVAPPCAIDMAFDDAFVINASGPHSIQEFAHEATFVYEPGRYEILGPLDQDLPTTPTVQDEYHSPSILGYKIRATYHHWLDKHPLVSAYLYEGTKIWLAPEYCRPVILTTGQARIWICFGHPQNEQHWGWITSDPYPTVLGKSEPWIRLSPIEWPSVTPSAETTVTVEANSQQKLDDQEVESSSCAGFIKPYSELCKQAQERLAQKTRQQLLTSAQAPGSSRGSSSYQAQSGKDEAPTTSDAQDASGLRATPTGQPLPTATEACTKSPIFLKAIIEMAADRTTTQQGKGSRERRQHNTTSKSPSWRVKLDTPMALPMAREMSGINALNLEPGLPNSSAKDWPHVSWIQHRQHTHGMATSAAKGSRKDEFEHDLEIINRSTVLPLGAKKQRAKPPSTQKTKTMQTTGCSSMHPWQ
jgi:hypothetical protein